MEEILKPYGEYEDSVKLTDEQLKQVAEAAESQKNPTNDLMRDIKSGKKEVEVSEGLKSTVCNMSINGDTGTFDLKPIDKENSSLTLEELEDVDGEEILSKVKISDSQIDELSSMYGVDDFEETMKFMEIVKKCDAGEKVKFEDLPPMFQKIARTLASSAGVPVNEAATDMAKMALNDLKHSQIYTDYNNLVKKELDIPNLTEMFAETLQDNIENGFEKKAQECIDKVNEIESLGEGATDKQRANVPKLLKRAETYRAIIAEFKHTYMLDKLSDFVANNKTFVKKLRKEVKRYERWVTDFNYKYKGSKFTIQDITLIINSLMREFETSELKLTLDEAKGIMILISKQVQNYNANDPVEHAYMFYLVYNFISLNYIAPGKSKFMDEFKERIVDLVHQIRKLNEVE